MWIKFFFGLFNSIDTFISIGKDSLSSNGDICIINILNIYRKIDATTFVNQIDDKKEIEKDCRNTGCPQK